MLKLLTRLRRRTPRHYALLDEHGRCRMLFSGASRPEGANWVEVQEARLSWIGRPLPTEGLRAA